MIKYVLSNYSFSSLLKLTIEEYLWSIAKHIPGLEGVLIRRGLFRLLAKHCGKNLTLQRCVHVRSCETFSVGKNFYANRGCHFDAYGGLIIGDDVGIGPNTTIITMDHQFATAGTNYRNRKFKGRQVEIGDGTIIGAHCYINPGVKIGKHCIIAAGSSIFIDIPDGAMVGPAPMTSYPKAMRSMLTEFGKSREKAKQETAP
jgi:acetyltransferase-like isoleucine patch superfamily enzyme